MKLRSTLGGLILFLLISSRSEAPGCGPFFADPVFTFSSYPTDPAYAQGRLGIVRPTFWRRFLVIAYRHMSGRPLSKTELESLAPPSAAVFNPASDAREEWKKARKAASPQAADVEVDDYRSDPKTYGYFLNCGEDAFKTATVALRTRSKEWLAAQDVVFSNCRTGRNIPAELSGAGRADRDYQIAAAHFYSESYEEAHRRFRSIAADPASPWRASAPYLAARALIRAATVPFEGRDKWDRDKLGQADQELAAMLKDPAHRAYHVPANRLRQWLALRLRPAEELARLTRELSAPSANFAASLTDYTYLMDSYSPAWAGTADLGDMTRWIVAFQAGDAETALAQWQATKSAPWLLAALATASPKQIELIDAARAVPSSSPAYATVLHHRLRLQREGGQSDAVRDELDKLLPAIEKEQTRSAYNSLLTERLPLSRSIDEFVRFAPRRPVGVYWTTEQDTEAPKDSKALLDEDGAKILNTGMPLSAWLAAINHARLPPEIAHRLRTAAFPRAVLLGDHAASAIVAQKLGDVTAGYLKAPAAERSFAAAYAILRNPGFRLEAEPGMPMREDSTLSDLDSLRQNWWCALDPKTEPMPAAFLSSAQKAAFEKEWAKLAAAPSAPEWLGRQAIEWAKSHREDPRSPEALHLTVRATRYGCGAGMGDYGTVSKAAFDLLHRHWPQSEWAKKTRYWFN